VAFWRVILRIFGFGLPMKSQARQKVKAKAIGTRALFISLVY
jgi:hypothetical protein